MKSIDHPSCFLTESQIRDLGHAAGFAGKVLRKPLNQWLVTNWDDAGILDNRVQITAGKFRKLARDWLARRDVPLVALYVFENPPRSTVGVHENLLIHLPAEHIKSFRNRIPDWLAKSGARWPNHPHMWHMQPIYDLPGLLDYICKGADDKTRLRLRLRYGDPDWRQGSIRGQRCGTSEAIGPKARAGFKAR